MPYPAKHVSLRGIEEERYVLLDVTEFDRGGPARIIEEIEVSRALFEVFEGAVVFMPYYIIMLASILTLFVLVHSPRHDLCGE
jgi:hypothetical protein